MQFVEKYDYKLQRKLVIVNHKTNTCTYVTQHDKTHKNVPEIKNELLVSYERTTL